MRVAALSIVVVVASGVVAHADLKGDVEKLVHTNLKAVAAGKFDDFDRTVSGGRVLVLPNGKTSIEGGLVADVYGAGAKKVAHKIEKLHVVVDASKNMAWFHGAFTATFTGADKKKVTQSMRISGIAADEGEPVGWKIQALMYSRTMLDRDLHAHAAAATRGKATTTGEAAIAKLVAAWFDGGSIANDRSKNVAVAVNGTSPIEIGNGAFAVQLVKAWEGMKMWASTAEATVFAHDEIAFVRAEVMTPVKEQACKLVLGVILMKENNVWRWVSLSFTPAV
jgi:hypothetical protein